MRFGRESRGVVLRRRGSVESEGGRSVVGDGQCLKGRRAGRGENASLAWRGRHLGVPLIKWGSTAPVSP